MSVDLFDELQVKETSLAVKMTSVLWNSNVHEAADNFTAVKMKGVSRRWTDSFAGWNAG